MAFYELFVGKNKNNFMDLSKYIIIQDHIESSICISELPWFLHNIKSVKMEVKADHTRKKYLKFASLLDKLEKTKLLNV